MRLSVLFIGRSQLLALYVADAGEGIPAEKATPRSDDGEPTSNEVPTRDSGSPTAIHSPGDLTKCSAPRGPWTGRKSSEEP